MNLNSSQEAACNHMEGPCLVVAGPGSGKTAVLTNRICRLIEANVPADKILVITFTKAAAMEMKERFNRLMANNNAVTFGTFHSLFWGILQRECGYKNTDIIMGKVRSDLLKQAMKMADSTDEDSKETLKAYESLKTKYHLIDFDDMLIKALELFKAKPEVLKRWQNRFDYFLVDEMQDMNDIQYELISLLSKRTKNIFCVGDDDQSIYGFRGANPKVMHDFKEDFQARQIILNHNYRNPGNIVKRASTLISNNTLRFEKEIISTKDSYDIKTNCVRTPSDEANHIVETIKSLMENKVPLDDIAILYRNHSDARFVVEKLLSNEIPIYIKEKSPNIYTHFVIEDMLAYFQIAVGNCTRARLLRIANRPNRFIHRAAVEKASGVSALASFYRGNSMMEMKVDAFIKDINLISKMSPVAAINYIRNIVGYGEFLKTEAMENGVEPDEYYSVLEFFVDVVRECRTLKAAIEKINYLKLKIDYDNKNKNMDKAAKVGLYTLHASKGLEFNHVFIIGVNEGVIPTLKNTNIEDIEGERRLFYVGVTRAAKYLYLSYVETKNRDRMYPSRFITELGIEDITLPPHP